MAQGLTGSWLLPLVAVGAAALTGAVRRYALASRVLDFPNARSAHSAPTPRGGGAAIVLSFLAAVTIGFIDGVVDGRTAIALMGAGGISAGVGFLDDHRSIAPRWRLICHFVAGAWALAWLGGLPAVEMGGASRNLGWAGHLLAALYLVWLLNLYNFMDGIDGIAAVEAVTVGLGAAVLAGGYSSRAQDWLLPAWLAMAALGFLAWNWPPAKIFMGDAGSGFLGITLGVLSLQAAWIEPKWLWVWAILLGVFVVDASVTLILRLRKGQKPHEAHRSHAYQHAARQVGSHLPVTVTIGVINLVWLWPIGWLVARGSLDGLIGCGVAYAPLVWLGIHWKAGQAPAASESA